METLRGKGSLMKHGLVCLLMVCAGLVASCASLDQLMAIEVDAKNQSYWNKEKFMEEYTLSEAEYIRWRKEVLEALSDPQSVDPLVGESKQVVCHSIRVEIPSKEEIIGIREEGKIILTDMAMYRIYRRPVTASSYDRGCHRVNYESLAVGVLNRYSGSRGFNSESWTYHDFSKIGKITSEKLESILTEKQEMRRTEERKREEAKEKKRAEEEARLAAEKAAKKKAEKERIAALLAWDDTAAKARANAMKGKTIVFKSFYLGMPIEDAMHLLYKKMYVEGEANCVQPHVLKGSEMRPELTLLALLKQNMESQLMGYTSAEIQQAGLAGLAQEKGSLDIGSIDPSMKDENLYVIAQDTYLDGLLEATPDGKVTRIMLDGFMIDKLFDSTDLDGEHFAEQFRSAYKVPYMERTVNTDSLEVEVEWSCTTPDGAKLTIDSKKTLVLEKVASQAERKQAFD